MCNNVDKPQKPGSKGHMLHDFIYVKYPEDKSTEIKQIGGCQAWREGH
jgi:hypothetical protein